MDIDFLKALCEIRSSTEPVAILRKNGQLLLCTNADLVFDDLRDIPNDTFVTGFQNANGESGLWCSWKSIKKLKESNTKDDFSYSDLVLDLVRSKDLDWNTSILESEFIIKVENMIDDMRRGEYYLSNLTRTIRTTQDVDVIYLSILSCIYHDTPFRFTMRYEDKFILGLSPESFMKIDKAIVHCEPMKGTARSKEGLLGNKKEHDENTMMIDLVRSDLSKICLPETIQVLSRNNISSHPGLAQMSSKLTGTLNPDLKIQEAIASMMPIASVTGTPKPHVQKIINRIEPVDRDTYCGTYGWINTTDNSCDLAVAIRTIINAVDTTSFGVGSGITLDSNPMSEWKETELKAERLVCLVESSVATRDDSVFTSLLAKKDGSCFALEQHCDRLSKHASELGMTVSPSEIFEYANHLLRNHQIEQDSILRIVLSPNSKMHATLEPVFLSDSNIVLGVAPVRTWARNESPKFTNRRSYINALTIAKSLAKGDIEDAILINKRNILETTRANIFLDLDGIFVTPKLQNGMIKGVARQMIETKFKELGIKLEERMIDMTELKNAIEIVTTNSIRGVQAVEMISSKIFDEDIKIPITRGKLWRSVLPYCANHTNE